MSTIKRDSPIPLYFQLRSLLSERIVSGEWQPGDMLPTEEQLQEQYALSRTTVRQALKELEIEGLITRFRGRGTFVAKPKYSHSPEPHFSLTDMLLQQGATPGWRVLSSGTAPAPEDVAERLQVEPDTPLFFLQRLRLADGEPIGYHMAYVSPVVSTAVDDSKLAEGGSLHYLSGADLLKGSYADRVIEAIAASEHVAHLLQIDVGSPLLLIRRLVMAETGTPLEDLRAMYRGDRFQYHIRHMPGSA